MDRRQQIRIQFGLEVEYAVNDANWSYQTETQDCSEGGLLFRSELYFDVGASLEVTLFGFSRNQARVRRCQKIENQEIPDLKPKARYRLEGAYAVDWAVRSVDLMFGLAGAAGLYESGHAARAFRDAHAVKQHFSFNTDIAGTTYGRIALGLPNDNPTL